MPPGRPLANDDNSRRIFNETSATLAVGGVPGFFEPRVPPPCSCRKARPRRSASTTPSPLQGDAARARRFRSSEFRCGAAEHRRGAGAHRQHEIFRHRQRSRARSMSWRAARCLRVSAHRNRQRALLGRRPRLQHAARICARAKRPAPGHGHLPGRPVQRQRLHAANAVRHRPAGEGNPLFEPHPAQHRHLPRDADHSQGHPPFARDGSGRALRKPRLAAARRRELRRRGHDLAAHSPARGLLDTIQRLRVLAILWKSIGLPGARTSSAA